MKKRKVIEGIYIDGSIHMGDGAFMISGKDSDVILVGPKLEVKKDFILGGVKDSGFFTKKLIKTLEHAVEHCKREHKEHIKLKRAMRRKK